MVGGCRIKSLAALLPGTGDIEACSTGTSAREFCTTVRSPKEESVRKHSRNRVVTADSKEWTKRALTFRK
jgi:hypothetical protein